MVGSLRCSGTSVTSASVAVSELPGSPVASSGCSVWTSSGFEGVLWPKICHCTVSPQQLFRVVNWLCQFCDSRSCTGHSFESAWLEELDRCMLRVIDVRWLVSDDRLCAGWCLMIDCAMLGIWR